MRISFTILLILVFMNSCNQNRIKYPQTRKVDTVDNYFGTMVPDPYRWLENDTAAEVKEWTKAQNKLTFDYLAKIPFRDKIKNRLTEIFNYPRYSSPFRQGEYYFFSKNDGLQNQSVIYYQKGLDGKPEIFIDPNKLSPDGTIRIVLLGFSKDYKYVAYSRSEAGSDNEEIHVMQVADKKELADVTKYVKFSGAAWLGNGYFYSGFDKPAQGNELKGSDKFQKLYYHKLGEPQEKDEIVYEDKDHPFRTVGAGITEDRRFLILSTSEGTNGNELFFKNLSQPGSKFIQLVKGFENNSDIIDNDGSNLFVRTDIAAQNYKVVLVDSKHPEQKNWKVLIPEKPEVLNSASTSGGFLFCSYLKDAATKVFQNTYDGKEVREIMLPTLGTASGFTAERPDSFCFYTFTSFTYPPTIFKFFVHSGKSEIFRKSEVRFNPEGFETRQVFYTSKDSTKVSMFLVYKKGLKLNGNNPGLLYGYGGFNVSMEPVFSPSNLILLENGGVYALANIRGGGEYGEAWHKAGMKLKKQNVFDDFIAAAEYLIREKYTRKDLLAIFGGSNGGLLIGACMTQRPDLFKVAFPAVGVMDMLRYHKFTIGWAWATEYGSSDSARYFKYLYGYSPLHNIKENVAYPATLVTTADHDNRVVPAHSFKFISTLQAHHSGNSPVLIRIQSRSGHGASNTSKAIEEAADRWAFMFYNMGLTPDYK
jgi:prolyl oligopeptidase